MTRAYVLIPAVLTVGFLIGFLHWRHEVSRLEADRRSRIEFARRQVESDCPVDVCVRNCSPTVFDETVVGGKIYGRVRPGETTSHQRWSKAPRGAYISIMLDGRKCVNQPYDFAGEPSLVSGRYRFEISVERGQPVLVIVKEEANQTPEPTPTSVTPRADARVAPAAVVAHL